MNRALIVSFALLTLACGDPAEPDAGVDGGQSSSDAGTDGGPGDAGPPAAPDAGPDIPPCYDAEWPAESVAIEEAMVVAINARRASPQTCGTDEFPAAPPAALLPSLREASRCHALWMQEQDAPSATGEGGSSFSDRMAAAGYTGTPVGGAGSLAQADSTGEELVDALFGLASVCRALMNPDAVDVGVGVAPELVGTRRYYDYVIGQP